MLGLYEQVTSVVRQRHLVFALEGLGARIGLIVTGAVTPITQSISKIGFCRLDLAA